MRLLSWTLWFVMMLAAAVAMKTGSHAALVLAVFALVAGVRVDVVRGAR